MKVCLSCGGGFTADDWTCPRCRYHPPVGGTPRFSEALQAIDRSASETLFARLAEVEPHSFWFRARNRLLVWTLRTYFPAARSLLDLGCGAGFVLQGIREALPGMRLVGSDPFPPALAAARQRVPDVELLQFDGLRVPFASEFDVVAALDVLEHVDDDRALLVEMARAVKPGGGVMITVPQHRWLWGVADDFALHRRRYSRGELVSRLRQAGLVTVWATSFVSVLVPAMALARLWPRHRATYDPVYELRPGRVLNPLFEAALDLERRVVIERGHTLPVGGSLLVVARRAGALDPAEHPR